MCLLALWSSRLLGVPGMCLNLALVQAQLCRQVHVMAHHAYRLPTPLAPNQTLLSKSSKGD